MFNLFIYSFLLFFIFLFFLGGGGHVYGYKKNLDHLILFAYIPEWKFLELIPMVTQTEASSIQNNTDKFDTIKPVGIHRVNHHIRLSLTTDW